MALKVVIPNGVTLSLWLKFDSRPSSMNFLKDSIRKFVCREYIVTLTVSHRLLLLTILLANFAGVALRPTADDQGRIRFCALILDFDEKYIFNEKCQNKLNKIRCYWLKISNIFRKNVKNLNF